MLNYSFKISNVCIDFLRESKDWSLFSWPSQQARPAHCALPGSPLRSCLRAAGYKHEARPDKQPGALFSIPLDLSFFSETYRGPLCSTGSCYIPVGAPATPCNCRRFGPVRAIMDIETTVLEVPASAQQRLMDGVETTVQLFSWSVPLPEPIMSIFFNCQQLLLPKYSPFYITLVWIQS